MRRDGQTSEVQGSSEVGQNSTRFLVLLLSIVSLLMILTPAPAQAADPSTIPECSAQRIDPRNLESCINPSNSTFPWIVETWRWSLSFVNLFAVVVLIAMAFSNILYALPILEPYRIRQLLPSFIGGIVLANLSLLFCRIIVSTADLLMSGGGFEVTTQELWSGWGFEVGRLKDGVIPALYGDNVDPNPGALLFQLLISTLLTYAPIIALTILAFVFFIRSGIIFLLTAISPLAFGSIIFPATRQYLQRWWDTYWKWLYGGVGSYLILMLAANISSKTTANLISSSGAVSAINLSLTYLLSLALVYFAIITPFKLGGELGARWSNFGKGLWNKAKWLGGKGVEATKYGAQQAGYWSKYASAKGLTESTKNLQKVDTKLGEARGALAQARAREQAAMAAGAPEAAAARAQARQLEADIRQGERLRAIQARKVQVAQGIHGTLHSGDFRKEAKEARGKMRERTMGAALGQSTLRERTLGKYLGDDAMRTLLAAQKEKANAYQLPEEAQAALQGQSPWFRQLLNDHLDPRTARDAEDLANRTRLLRGIQTGDVKALNDIAQLTGRSRGEVATAVANHQAYIRLSNIFRGQQFSPDKAAQFIRAAYGEGSPPPPDRYGRGRGPRPGGGGRGGRGGGGPYAGAEEVVLGGTGGPAVVQGAPAQVSQTVQELAEQKAADGGRTRVPYIPGGGAAQQGAQIGAPTGSGSDGGSYATGGHFMNLGRQTINRITDALGGDQPTAGGGASRAGGPSRTATVNIVTDQANVAAGQTRVGGPTLPPTGLGVGGARGPLSVTMSGRPSTIGQAGGAPAGESVTISPAAGFKSSAPSGPPTVPPAPRPSVPTQMTVDRKPFNPAQVQGRAPLAPPLPPAPPSRPSQRTYAPPYIPGQPAQPAAPPIVTATAPSIRVAPQASPAPTIVGQRTQTAATFTPRPTSRANQRLATPTATRIPAGPAPRPVAPAASAPNSDALKVELQRIDESRERERRKIWTSDRSVEERMRLERENTRIHDSQAIAAENRYKNEQASDISSFAQDIVENADIVAAGQATRGPQLAKSLDLNPEEDEDEDDEKKSK